MVIPFTKRSTFSASLLVDPASIKSASANRMKANHQVANTDQTMSRLNWTRSETAKQTLAMVHKQIQGLMLPQTYSRESLSLAPRVQKSQIYTNNRNGWRDQGQKGLNVPPLSDKHWTRNCRMPPPFYYHPPVIITERAHRLSSNSNQKNPGVLRGWPVINERMIVWKQRIK